MFLSEALHKMQLDGYNTVHYRVPCPWTFRLLCSTITVLVHSHMGVSIGKIPRSGICHIKEYMCGTLTMLGTLAKVPSVGVVLTYPPTMRYEGMRARLLLFSAFIMEIERHADKLKEQHCEHPCILQLDPMTVIILINFLLSPPSYYLNYL